MCMCRGFPLLRKKQRMIRPLPWSLLPISLLTEKRFESGTNEPHKLRGGWCVISLDYNEEGKDLAGR